MTTVGTVDKVAAALCELLADQPDLDIVRDIVSEIPPGEVYPVGSALIKLAGMFEYRAASQRVKASAS